jgi:hypothetical protein
VFGRGTIGWLWRFEVTHFIKIIVWKDLYVPNYPDVFGGDPRVVTPSSKDKEKKEEWTSKFEDEDQKPGEVVNPPPFNPKVQFFAQFFQDY